MRARLAVVLILAACGGAQKKQPAPVTARPVETATTTPAPQPPSDPSAGPVPIGVPSCDLYLRRMYACVWAPGFPAASRDAMLAAFAETAATWREAAATGPDNRQALETGCRRALDASRQAMATMCPDVF
jgi:hypothetical protein